MIPEFLEDTVERAGYGKNDCKYVNMGYEVLTSASPEKVLVSSGYLTCQSLVLNFPLIDTMVMTHHNPIPGDSYGKMFARLAPEILAENLWLKEVEGEFTLFEQEPSGNDLTPVVQQYFPEVVASEVQLRGDREISLAFMLYADRDSGKVSKRVYPFYAE